MSAASPPSRINNAASAEVRGGRSTPNGNRVDEIIDQRIDETCRALWRAELTRRTLGLLICLNVIFFAWIVVDQWIYSPGVIVRTLSLGSILGIISAYIWRYILPILKSSIAPEYAARAIDRDLAEARQSLLSYLTLREASRDDSLQSGVVRSIGTESGKKLQQHDTPPSEATGTVRWWIIAIASVTALAMYVALSPKSSVQAITRLGAPLANIAAPQRVKIDQVTPGNTRVTAGLPVEISASVDGLFANESVVCLWTNSSDEERLELSLDPTSNRYIGDLPVPHSAIGVINYRIIAGDASAGPFELIVEDIPVVTIDHIEYRPPAYTRLQDFSKSVGAIRAVDGTNITVHAKVNRVVNRAKIEFNPAPIGSRIQATAGALEMNIDASGTTLSASFNLRDTQELGGNRNKTSYRVLVWDSIEQENVKPIIYPIEIVPDLPPEINITVPSQSPKNLPYNAQQLVEIHASDPDFGLSRIELEIHYGTNRTLVPVLWESSAGELGRQIGSIPIRPEELSLQIGDSIELVGIATDNRSDHLSDLLKPNIVRTDAIQLHITSPSSLPAADDPAADGVSERKNSPESGSGSSQNDEAGGAGSGGSGDSQATSQQNGEGQGETGSSSQSPKGNDESSGSGSNSGDQQNQNPDTTDRSNPDSMPTGDAGGSSDPSNSQASANGGDSDQSDTDSETQERQANPLDPNKDENASASSEANSSQESASNSLPENQSPADSNSNQQSSGANTNQAEGSAKGESDSRGSGDMPNDQSNNSNPQQNESSASPSGQSTQANQSKPDHDGEAFERIRDYLDELQGSESRQGDSSSSESNSVNQPSSPDNDGANNGNQTAERNSNEGSESGDDSGDSESGEQGSSLADSTDTGNRSDGSDSGETADTDNGNAENASDSQNTADGNTGENSNDSTNSQKSTSQGSQGESSQGNKGESSTENSEGQKGQQQADSDLSSQAKEASETSDESAGDASQDPSSASNDSQPSTDPADHDSTAETSDNQEQNQASGESANSQNTDPSTPNPSKSQNSQNSSDSSTSSPAMGDEVFGDGSLANPQSPDEVNLDYAKQATDLVLDYLESTRDQPNQDLLKRLQWSEEELKAFVERWRRIRELPTTKGKQGRDELEDTLRSLGLRDPKSITIDQQESSDNLRAINDSGNIQQVPAAYRDAFNAFRREMSRVKE
ncbi:MAG: hypothetical protein L7U72_07940 [Rubripirellula sp.]|nr:hypothetical protein [Rubripirellula sp.]